MRGGADARLWLHGAALLACSSTLILLASASTLAQACRTETEPNDTLEAAVTSVGPACVAGQLTEDDQVDHVLLWTISPEEAGQRWDLAISGVDGAPVILAVSRVTSDPAAATLSVEPGIVEVRTVEGVAEPAAHRDLWLDPGRYLLSVGPGGPWTGTPKGYEVEVGRGTPLPGPGDREPNDVDATASPVEGAFEVSGDAAGTPDHFAWEIDETTEGTESGLWVVEARTARDGLLAVTVSDATGAIEGDARSSADGVATLPDLSLSPGIHMIRIAGSADPTRPYILRAYRDATPIGDPEPNDVAARALPIVPGQLVTGRLGGTPDRDAYRLRVDEALGPTLLDARLIVQTGPVRRLCLSRLTPVPGGQEAADELTCADGQTGATLGGLVLSPGDYELAVSGASSLADPYYLRVDTTVAPLAGYELEPNDSVELATPMAAEAPMRGRLVNPDFFRVHVDGEPQLWQIEARGPEVRLSWIRTDGFVQATGTDPDDAADRSVISDAYLIPGDHWFRLDGTGEYELTLVPLGPPIPGGEREPNGDLGLANSLAMNGVVTGRVSSRADSDVFRFSLAGPEHVKVTLEPPSDAAMRLYPRGDTATITSYRESAAPGEPIELDLILPAGDHAVEVEGPPGEARYRVVLERLDPFVLALDQEPNDDASMARAVTPDLLVRGAVERGDAADWYRLPPLPAAGELTFLTAGEVNAIALDDGTSQTTLASDADGATFRSPPLAAGTAVAFGISGSGKYDVMVHPGSTGLPAMVRDLAARFWDRSEAGSPLEMALQVDTLEVAAFEAAGQEVPGRLTLANRDDRPLEVRLDAATSDPRWRVRMGHEPIELGPGATLEVPVSVVVPADAWADRAVRATVLAMAGDARVTAFAEVTPRADAPLVEASTWWPLPDELLGGLDAASLGLGAVPVDSIDPVAEALLHDGVAALGTGLSASGPPLTLTVDLAGDEPVPVAGIILDPTSGPGGIAGTVRGFELLLSGDGLTYEPALVGELSGALTDQAFVLPNAGPARFAQLRITSRFPGGTDLRLGEWKVVATPGWMPQAGPLDIADPALGGHVAWLDPQANSPDMLDAMLIPDAALPLTLGYDPRETGGATWAIGFQDGRAAQVTELEWVDPPGSRADLRLEGVDVASSMDGPLGPWTPLGTWALDRDGAGMVASFRLSTPTWMRYIRMSGRFADQTRGVVELPDAIGVLERAPGDDYRSVVGEWGYASSAGPWEWQQPVPEPAGCLANDAADGLTRPDRPLEAGSRARGCVARGVTEDAYAFTVPEGQRSVRFSVSGRPTVGVGLRLLDASGREVPLVSGASAAGQVEHVAAVSPGGRYRLSVSQPAFSVVVLFDTSGSVGPFVPIMTGALRSYLGGVIEGEEALQLFDLEGPPLPEEFSDDPWLILDALDAHEGSKTLSSNAESGLIDGLDALAARTGTRAIFLMTDAETASFHRHAELWRWLGLVQPRLFTMQVSGAFTPQQDKRVMQDWAAVGGGAYAMTRYGGDIERAFDRMATWLRRPADYGLLMGFSPDPPPEPGPGSIAVVSDPNAPPVPQEERGDRAARTADVAVEIVLDTSGSMLERLGRRQRRIDVAKRVLARLVAEQLEPGTPVALRVFRQERRSCETELAVPLSPLDPVAMGARIESIEIDRTVRTPLAAAITAVGDDLGTVAGPRIVIVVSDGQESCKGDPAAAVQALVDQGFDVTVNVVGLGLDRKTRRKISRLADVGGGDYYDARNASGLEEALKGALGAPYVVRDAAGVEVGRGTVDGPPVVLPPGTYRISLAGATAGLDAVVLESGEQEIVTAPATP